MPRLHSFTLEQWIEQYRVLTEKNRALLKSGLNEKRLAERATNKLEAERPHTAADRLRTASADARPPRSGAETGQEEKPAVVGTPPNLLAGGAPAILLYLLPGDSNWTFAKTPPDCIVGSPTAE